MVRCHLKIEAAAIDSSIRSLAPLYLPSDSPSYPLSQPSPWMFERVDPKADLMLEAMLTKFYYAIWESWNAAKYRKCGLEGIEEKRSKGKFSRKFVSPTAGNLCKLTHKLCQCISQVEHA